MNVNVVDSPRCDFRCGQGMVGCPNDLTGVILYFNDELIAGFSNVGRRTKECNDIFAIASDDSGSFNVDSGIGSNDGQCTLGEIACRGYRFAIAIFEVDCTLNNNGG